MAGGADTTVKIETATALNQGVGYGIVIGLGALFALGMIFVTFILKRYNRELQTSEMFNTAGRTVKSGLVGSAVVSSWTWAATLLQSSGVCYRYGVSGPLWYASGATVQILLFATLAIELKRRAPNAHTYLEVIRARFGTLPHIVFMIFGLMTNILVSLMLIVGGSATINALTGMHTIAAIYLLPVGVVAYTLVGGLKATILTDWIHTFILLIIIIVFALSAYASSEVLGSPSAVYDLLVKAAAAHPVDGNHEGSYLTMRSREGAIFFVINIVGNFGTVFLDNGYYNKAIAASPVHALPGYILGGLCWFAIPWLTATTMGLSGLALESSPRFPTYPNRMPEADVSAGLVLPYAAVALLGKGGAAATLLIVFMAVTSATSSQLIAVSSIIVYDLYRTYIKPEASGKRLIYMSHVIVCAYALFIASFSVGLWYAGISMGYLYVMMGVIISSAVLPAALVLTWSGLNKWAAALSPVLGLCVALVAWLVTAKKECGEMSVACTGSNMPMLAGNVAALLSPVVFVPVLTLVFGKAKYDWKSMMAISRGDDHDVAGEAGVDLEEVPGGREESEREMEEEQKKLRRASKISKTMTAVLTLALLILWPMPLYGTGYIFSKPFFTGWVVVGIIWIFLSFIGVGLFPIYEGRETLIRTCKYIWWDITGKGVKAIHADQAKHAGEVVVTEGKTPGDQTPEEKSVKGEKVREGIDSS
ncbi:urea active transporter [Neurospora crassa]|uniref:Urea active transporter n=1 Tax=Neurospora crassa (strain ATCC 24698 / 74-OR23-1A / CBS 708.71 / DSM 1257 / FGSC 987) TaxID=367110 RepID=Q7S147_NEUCR|nr:urea active transporter [Neurospora crassa OR74A]EAA29072.1 urea active transporter [Neurospora crassa OR74A]KHE79296.1 urea active transporter [Neurospora crassa]|eukprot:XP_958308.1 urea active transporter [Neurospora crassa OR74A]